MPLIVSSNRYWDVTWNEIKICHIVSWTINLSSCHHNNLSELREKVKCYKNDFIVDSDEYVLCGLQCKKLDWCQHKWIKIIIVCVIYLVLSLFGNISCRSNRNHQSLKHNMIPAKTHAKGLTVEIERDVWTSKYRRVSGPKLHGLLQRPVVWLQHCSEVTADPVTPGSAAWPDTAVSVKMGPHQRDGTGDN